MTLDDVLELAQKGDELIWGDFNEFRYHQTGSGLYIRVYEINDMYSVWIGGNGPENELEPMYIYLKANDGTDDYIDIRDGGVTDFIEQHRNNAIETDPLDEAISTAILNHYAGGGPDGLIHAESHVLLANEIMSGTPQIGGNSHMEETTVYLLVLHQEYSVYDGTLEARGGSYVPTAITFSVSESGEYALKEYWEPRDGSYYVDDIREKFPGAAADNALNHQAYIEDLKDQCYNKAIACLNSTGGLELRIADLLDTIQSSPATSSDPGDYIKAHDAEYQELLGYGEFTLRYCFDKFLQGGQTDLEGQMMAVACRDIMLAWGEGHAIDFDPLTGQDWFDSFYNSAIHLTEQYSDEDMEKFYPASTLLLRLINQFGVAGNDTETEIAGTTDASYTIKISRTDIPIFDGPGSDYTYAGTMQAAGLAGVYPLWQGHGDELS